MAALTWPIASERARSLFPGVMACGVVAAAATFLGDHYGAPVLLFALLIGLGMNFLSGEGPCAPGIEFCARSMLRIGVALLGLRITFAQVVALGWHPLVLVVLSVAITITISVVAARALGFEPLFGLLTGGATAICGASAALALAAALPAHPRKERATLFTVIGVSALSTFAMVAYPMVVKALALSPQAAGIFLGGTIHDVAQVVGAGYSISPETGDAATLVKLLRVAMLLPVIVVATMITRARAAKEAAALAASGDDTAAATTRPPLLPGFAVAFALLVVVNSTGFVPHAVQTLGNDVSRWFLVAAIAGIGMKAQLKELITVGLKPVALMVGETVFLAGLVLLSMRWLG
jgi:uncharacterized integral membrane protein (TIGR00698 family)